MSKGERSAVSPLAELAEIAELWSWWLKDSYSLDVQIEDTGADGTPEIHHFVFGPAQTRDAATGEQFHQHVDLKELIAALRNGEAPPGCVMPPRASSARMHLFSEDLIYTATLDAAGPRLAMNFELRSAAFHKGRIPRYVSAVRLGRKWNLHAGHPEVQSLASFEGTMEECLREIFLAGSAAPHPYQSYIDADPIFYREALKIPRRIP